MAAIIPMTVSGVQHLVERAYRESGELQYVRELVVNAVEAGATKIELGPEWSAVQRLGVYRLMVADNGKGMAPDELLRFLNTFGGGGKPIGDAHENFGVGAKTSLLPWNHAGVVVVSWTEQNPDGAMVWLARDSVTGEYGAKKFETEDGFHEVVNPFGEWTAVRPAWLEAHGTVVVCLGNTGAEDTFVGKDSDGDIKAIAAYLNKRLWEVGEGIEIHVQEVRTTKRDQWPRSLSEASGPQAEPDRRWNRRQIRGARHYVVGANAPKALQQGTVALEDGTEIDWYLRTGDKSWVHSYAHMNGFIAALYRNELYDTQLHASQFRSFGITQSVVRSNLTLIARPPLARDAAYGVYPDTARNSLKIRGTRRAGEPLPWSDWAQEFAQKMPDEIRAALATAGPAHSGSLNDAQWRQRLVDRFGDRWKTLRWVPSSSGLCSAKPDTAGGGGRGQRGGKGGGSGSRSSGGLSRQIRAARAPGSSGVPARAVETRGGIPEFDWTDMANINDSDASRYAAAWCRPTADQPNGLVQLARDFPAVVEVKKYWRDQYPDHLGEEIDTVIEDVYGKAMVARIAHSEALVADPAWGHAEVEAQLRSPAALTMALLGLFSEDAMIASRLSGLGVRKKAS